MLFSLLHTLCPMPSALCLFRYSMLHALCTMLHLVTSNHIHLLVFAPNDMEAIPRLMQLVAGRTGQEFNLRRNRKGAYWEKRYNATAVQTGEHLTRCLLYIDLNMVRAGVVKHPKEWEHSGYHELAKPKQRYGTIKRSKVIEILEIKEQDFGKLYRGWLKEAIRKGNLSRDDVWSSEVAIGDLSFIEKIKKRLGLFVSRPEQRQHTIYEEKTHYGQHADIPVNYLEWECFLET